LNWIEETKFDPGLMLGTFSAPIEIIWMICIDYLAGFPGVLFRRIEGFVPCAELNRAI
jgi:hypothetical protein